MNETLNNNNLPEIPSGEELIQQKNEVIFAQDEWTEMDIYGNFLDVTEAYCAPKYLLSWDNVKFSPIGGVQVLTGQSGNGKTFTFTQMIVAVLRGNLGSLRYELANQIPNPTVLYIDTEQERENTKLVNLRIYEMMGWKFHEPHEEFRILCLREEETAINRWRKVMKAIDTIKPTVCFLDGMLDIVQDFNDNAECSEMVYKNMKLASHYDMSLWVLVHENQGSTKMVGHLGSILHRKVTDELSSVKEKDENTGDTHFTVKQKKNRGKDMKAWKFRIIDGPHSFGIPQIINDSFSGEEDLRLKFRSIMPAMGYNMRELRQVVVDAFRVNETQAKDLINKAVEEGILKKEEEWNGSHTKLMKCRFTFIDKISTEEDMPF